jgi:hypothetical protein
MRRVEQAIQRQIISGLRAGLPKSWLVFHVPNGGQRSKIEAAIFSAMGVMPGIPDIVILGETEAAATAWFLEVKSDTGRLTPIQKACHERLQELGFGVAVVRSWDEALKQIGHWRLPHRFGGHA